MQRWKFLSRLVKFRHLELDSALQQVLWTLLDPRDCEGVRAVGVVRTFILPCTGSDTTRTRMVSYALFDWLTPPPSPSLRDAGSVVSR